MDVLLVNNIQWMTFNVLLALIPVVFGALMIKTESSIVKSAAGFVWFFFLPNTIYLLTDVLHLLEDTQKLSGIYLFLDALLYLALIPLAVITFILAIDPFEKMFLRKRSARSRSASGERKNKERMPAIYILNFFVGLGVVLGWVQRANSWEIFTDPQKVILVSIKTVTSPELVILVFVFAIISQAVYMRFRKSVLKVFSI